MSFNLNALGLASLFIEWHFKLMKNLKLPTYFISHGGGPWPWLKREMPFYDVLEASLKKIPEQLGQKPKAILMISAHWEENEFTVMSTEKPGMIYDYGGFPEHTYQIKYSAPGSEELAQRVHQLVTTSGIPIHANNQRGYDHGAFVPAFPMYPDADVPMIQLSIKNDYDPMTHIKLGECLAPLRDEGILILGSGLSFHNLRTMLSRNPSAKIASKEFDQWLQKTLAEKNPIERIQKLIQWEQAPSAREAHPQEDHLVPLFVALGTALNEEATMIYHEDYFMGGISVSSFGFGV